MSTDPGRTALGSPSLQGCLAAEEACWPSTAVRSLSLPCAACRGVLARWKVWFLLRLADYELQEENQAGVIPRLQQAVAAADDSGPEDQVSFSRLGSQTMLWLQQGQRTS